MRMTLHDDQNEWVLSRRAANNLRANKMKLFFRIISLLFLNLLLASRATAADISQLRMEKGNTYIQFIGHFERSDIERFKELAYKRQAEGVLFDSPGGDLHAGLSIGQTIRELGLVTLVPSGAACFSACAIAWLGGSQRFMSVLSEVGFHAAYFFENGQARETGMGNALVGAYFTRIGLSERAVAYFTASPPQKILRLTPAIAQEVGVQFTLLDDRKSDKVSKAGRQDAARGNDICKVADPSGTPLNVRDTKDNIIDKLSNGTAVKILKERDAKGKVWALISISNVTSGWVYKGYLYCGDKAGDETTKKSQPTAGAKCKVTDPTGTPLNLRDSQRKIIGSMTNESVVTILRNGIDESGKPWAYVATGDGRQGWAYREYLSCWR